jgi:hypothetical protein
MGYRLASGTGAWLHSHNLATERARCLAPPRCLAPLPWRYLRHGTVAVSLSVIETVTEIGKGAPRCGALERGPERDAIGEGRRGAMDSLCSA